MSRITLAPNASGTGTLTIAAPNTNTDRTLTLPDATGTVAYADGSGAVRSDAYLDASGGNTATFNTVPLRPGVLDAENRIINGAFDFWQRGTSSTSTGFVAADRWSVSAAGGTFTQSRQAFTVGDTLGSNNPTYFLRQTVSGQTTSAQLASIVQGIEGVRSYAGQTITVLGWARRSSGTGNMAIEGVQGFGTGGSPSATITAISPTTVTLTSSFAPFAVTLTVPSITGKTLGTSGSDVFSIVFWTSAGSDYNARTNSLGLQTIGVDLWGVHIKVGTHTTAATDLYKQPEMGPEFVRCQRYYQILTVLNNSYFAQFSGSTFYGNSLFFPTQMRTSPSGSYQQIAGTTYWVHIGSQAFSAATTANIGVPTTSSSVKLTQTRTAGNSTPTAGNLYVLEADFNFLLDAEL
jgi:hypothetical protein